MNNSFIPICFARGKILSRPNRFLFEIVVGNERCLAHCPSTGSIGGLRNFENLPCLCTKALNSVRRTAYTVEAISLDNETSWIGIHQSQFNIWVHKWLQKNLLPLMINTENWIIQPEKKIGDSRIDFYLASKDQEIFLELKAPLKKLYWDELPENLSLLAPPSGKAFFERLVKHHKTLCSWVTPKKRVFIALCFSYNAVRFVPPPTESKQAQSIQQAVQKAVKKGFSYWQINTLITPTGVSLLDYFPLNFK